MKKTIFAVMLVGTVLVFTACKKDEEKVQKVVTQNATEITSNSAVLHAELHVADTTAPSTKGFCWSALPNPDINDSVTICFPLKNLFETKLSGLKPGTTYYYRAYIYEMNGETTYGEVKTFVTLPVPVIELKNTVGYTYSDKTVKVSELIKMGITGKNVGADLTRFRMTVGYYELVDTTFSASSFYHEIRFNFTNSGEADILMELWDKNQQKGTKALTITVEDNPNYNPLMKRNSAIEKGLFEIRL